MFLFLFKFLLKLFTGSTTLKTTKKCCVVTSTVRLNIQFVSAESPQEIKQSSLKMSKKVFEVNPPQEFNGTIQEFWPQLNDEREALLAAQTPQDIWYVEDTLLDISIVNRI